MIQPTKNPAQTKYAIPIPDNTSPIPVVLPDTTLLAHGEDASGDRPYVVPTDYSGTTSNVAISKPPHVDTNTPTDLVQPARGPAIPTVPILTPDYTNTDPNSTPVCDTELDTISDKPRDTTPLQQKFLRLLLNKNRSADPSRTVYWPGDRYSPPQHKGTSSSTHIVALL